MAPSQVLLKLPAELKKYGIDVYEMPGWETRQDSNAAFVPVGIIDHHDGMGLHNMNVPNNMIRPGQYASQIWVGWDGRVVMLGTGTRYHAGVGAGWGVFPKDQGNTHAFGIETDYSSVGPWPELLVKAWRIVRFCLFKLSGWTADSVNRRLCGHKEYAPGRKPDPSNFDMGVARSQLAYDLRVGYPPSLKPSIEVKPSPQPVPDVPAKDWFDNMDEATLRMIVSQEVNKARDAAYVLDDAVGSVPGNVVTDRVVFDNLVDTMRSIDQKLTRVIDKLEA